tara:strand:- start:1823 stop:2065 length:243 start_codon:yes stop_codon:yes gene_type:complete
MVDQVAREDVADCPRTRRPEILLSNRFVTDTLVEHAEELSNMIIPILRKSLGLHPMTVDERALSDFFSEESFTYTRDDEL